MSMLADEFVEVLAAGHQRQDGSSASFSDPGDEDYQHLHSGTAFTGNTASPTKSAQSTASGLASPQFSTSRDRDQQQQRSDTSMVGDEGSDSPAAHAHDTVHRCMRTTAKPAWPAQIASTTGLGTRDRSDVPRPFPAHASDSISTPGTQPDDMTGSISTGSASVEGAFGLACSAQRHDSSTVAHQEPNDDQDAVAAAAAATAAATAPLAPEQPSLQQPPDHAHNTSRDVQGESGGGEGTGGGSGSSETSRRRSQRQRRAVRPSMDSSPAVSDQSYRDNASPVGRRTSAGGSSSSLGPLRPTLYTPEGLSYRKRISQMTPEEQERLRESNRIMARRIRARQKQEREAQQTHLRELETNNSSLRRTCQDLRNALTVAQQAIKREYSANPPFADRLTQVLGAALKRSCSLDEDQSSTGHQKARALSQPANSGAQHGNRTGTATDSDQDDDDTTMLEEASQGLGGTIMGTAARLLAGPSRAAVRASQKSADDSHYPRAKSTASASTDAGATARGRDSAGKPRSFAPASLKTTTTATAAAAAAIRHQPVTAKKPSLAAPTPTATPVSNVPVSASGLPTQRQGQGQGQGQRERSLSAVTHASLAPSLAPMPTAPLTTVGDGLFPSELAGMDLHTGNTLTGHEGLTSSSSWPRQRLPSQDRIGWESTSAAAHVAGDCGAHARSGSLPVETVIANSPTASSIASPHLVQVQPPLSAYANTPYGIPRSTLESQQHYGGLLYAPNAADDFSQALPDAYAPKPAFLEEAGILSHAHPSYVAHAGHVPQEQWLDTPFDTAHNSLQPAVAGAPSLPSSDHGQAPLSWSRSPIYAQPSQLLSSSVEPKKSQSFAGHSSLAFGPPFPDYGMRPPVVGSHLTPAWQGWVGQPSTLGHVHEQQHVHSRASSGGPWQPDPSFPSPQAGHLQEQQQQQHHHYHHHHHHHQQQYQLTSGYAGSLAENSANFATAASTFAWPPAVHTATTTEAAAAGLAAAGQSIRAMPQATQVTVHAPRPTFGLPASISVPQARYDSSLHALDRALAVDDGRYIASIMNECDVPRVSEALLSLF
jgi:hypothetical protein